MGQNLNIVFEIHDLSLAKELSEDLKNLTSITLTHRVSEQGDRGTTAFKAPPEIILVEDLPEASDIFRKLAGLRKSFPLASIFVISADRRPEHIVEIMKAGAAEYFATPLDPQTLRGAIEKVREQRGRQESAAAGPCYSFISSKGGLGATVIAVNVATALAEGRGAATALCDMSFQSGDCSVLLDLVPETSIADVCRNFHRLDASFLKGAMIRHATGLNYLAAPVNPDDCEEITAEKIERICALTREAHRCVIIDCPSMSVSESNFQALLASDKVFIVSDLSVPAIRNAARLFQHIRKLGISTQKIEIVVNRYIKETPLSLDSAEKTLGKKIFWLFPNDFENVISSINRGIPLIKLNPRSPLTRNIVEFIQKLQHPAAHLNYRGVRGTFGKAV
ncbi:MAG TPA: AAA family ATPase [Desulfuromonadales bacterium]|nr:AAA family ATPase [Desulfuromonadales bacterium]